MQILTMEDFDVHRFAKVLDLKSYFNFSIKTILIASNKSVLTLKAATLLAYLRCYKSLKVQIKIL